MPSALIDKAVIFHACEEYSHLIYITTSTVLESTCYQRGKKKATVSHYEKCRMLYFWSQTSALHDSS